MCGVFLGPVREEQLTRRRRTWEGLQFLNVDKVG
jgi:hypothetical protein